MRRFVYERTLFISVVLWLYSPSIYNSKVNYDVENGVRKELEGILLCDETWISQQVKLVAHEYREDYMEFQQKVDALLYYIKENVIEKRVEVDDNTDENKGLF